MFKNFTYRQRFIYLLVGGVALLILVYMFSIDETLKLRRNYVELKKRYDGVFDASSSILFYEKELIKIDSLIGSENSKGNYTQEELLLKVTEFGRSHNLTVISFPAPHENTDNGYKVLTYEASISGKFNDLLLLLYELELGKYPGVIKSVNFELTKSQSQATTMLVMTLFIQEIKDIKDEKNL